MVDGQYKFSIGLDSKQLELDVAQAKKAFDSLVKQAQQAGAKIDNIPNPFENIGKSAPQVAQATQQFNGLNMATQQLVRELPAASMGLNTFFLAISNNLPIFTDQVKNLRQKGTSVAGVLKGIGSALFSWQTALVLGVTALSMYGKEIGAWISSLFKGKEAVDAMTKAEKTLRDVRRQGIVDAQEEITKIRLTVQAAQDATANIEERTNALRALKSEYPDYFANLSDEQIMYGDVADSVQALIDKTIALAQARKAFNQLVENEENMRLLESVEGYAKLRNELGRHAGSGHKKYRHTQQTGVDTGTMFLPTGYEYVESDDTKWNRTDALTDSYKRVLDAQDTFLDNLEEMGEKGNKEAKALFEKISEEYDGDVKAYIEAVRASNEQLNTEAGLYVTSKDGENKSAIEAAKREAKRKKKEAEHLKKERERRAKESAELSQKLQNDADQAEIDAMADGTNKKIAQIKLDYEKRKQTIDKVSAELAAKQGGTLTEEQQGWVNEAYKGNKMQATDEWEAYVEEQVEAAGVALRAKEDALKAEETVWNEYLMKYGTFQEKVKAITEKYATEIANAKSDGERMSLEAERDAALAAFEVQASAWAKDLANKSIAELNKMMREIEKQVEAKQEAFDALESSDSTEAKNYLKTINELKAKIAELKKQLSGASKEAKDGNWEGAAQVVQGIASAAGDAAGALEGMDDELANTINGMAKFANVAASLVSAIAAVATASTALNMALGVIGLIATAIQVVSTAIGRVVQEQNEVEKAIAEFSKRMKELNDELERMRRLGEIDSLKGTIFGEDAFGNFMNNLAVMRDALSELEDVRDRITQRMNLSIGFYKPDVEFANYEEVLRYLVGERIPELFEGGLTLDKLKTWRDTDGWAAGISDKLRELIDELIADWELYEESATSVTDYLTDIFSDLGASITDSLVDSFRNGTDAAEAMGDAASNVLERIATDMAHAVFIQPLLEQAQDGIEALNKQRFEGGLSDEEYMRQLMGITGTLMGNAKNAGEDMSAYLDTMRQMADEMGIDLFESDNAKNTTYAKGFQTMSQETGSELNGRFTDIQGQTHRIADAVEFMKGLQMQHTQHMQSVSNTLASIHNDTSLIAEHTKALARMDANLDAMRRAIDNGAI